MIDRIVRGHILRSSNISRSCAQCCRSGNELGHAQIAYIRRRNASTIPSPPPPEAAIEVKPRPRDLRSQLPGAIPHAEGRPRSLLRPWLFATTFMLVGLGWGQYIRLVIKPPEQPEPGSKEDKILISQIHSQAEKLPLVQELSSDPAWSSWDAYTTFSPFERAHRLTTGPLSGTRGIGGYQRIFHNESTGEFISVVWIGGHVTGWPGLAHGGLLATLMDESVWRCAVARFPSHTGVTANLQLNYRSPTFANAFHVIRMRPEVDGFTERKGRVKGRLETVDGRVCVESEGLIVVPKTLQLRVSESGF